MKLSVATEDGMDVSQHLGVFAGACMPQTGNTTRSQDVGSNPAPYCEDDTSTATHSKTYLKE